MRNSPRRIPGIPIGVGVGTGGCWDRQPSCWPHLFLILSIRAWLAEAAPDSLGLHPPGFPPCPPTLRPYPSQALFHSWLMPLLISRPVFLCGGDVTGESGYVASEGFPNLYPPNKECIWTITVRSSFLSLPPCCSLPGPTKGTSVCRPPAPTTSHP